MVADWERGRPRTGTGREVEVTGKAIESDVLDEAPWGRTTGLLTAEEDAEDRGAATNEDAVDDDTKAADPDST